LTPVVSEHEGLLVVRDDLYPGGTKARFIAGLFEDAREVVYATPAEGGAQTALAECARQAGKRLTLFVARRARPHPRTLMAKRLGAVIVQVAPGYLKVVQARAAAYAAEKGALLAPFGIDTPEAVAGIAAAARATGIEPDEVWCAAGSGVLARGLAAAWPRARRRAVQIGREVKPAEVAGAEIFVHPLKFGQACKEAMPFPSDPYYDAKAWQTAKARHEAGLVLFWNVTGPAV
jgi:threonine dehydratase